MFYLQGKPDTGRNSTLASIRLFYLHINGTAVSISLFYLQCGLVNKTFLSRPRPRPRPRLFCQDRGKTFYFEIKTKSKTFCRSSELAAIWNITSRNAVISYTQSPVMITFCPSTINKHGNQYHRHVTGIIMSPLYDVI